MSNYTKPHAEIFQTFTATPAAYTRPLSALVIGPNYSLSRYDVASEKANTVVANENANFTEYLNYYVGASGTVNGTAIGFTGPMNYSYPVVTTGATVDQEYTKVHFENAKAKYFPLDELYGTSVAVDYVTTANIADFTEAAITVDGTLIIDAHATMIGADGQTGALILVNEQTTASENGIYRVTDTGAGELTTWIRATDYASDSENINFSQQYAAETGAVNGGKTFVLASDTVPVIGTDDMKFVRSDLALSLVGLDTDDSIKYMNRIKVGGSLKTGATIDRSPWFSNRDVAVGDWVKFTGSAHAYVGGTGATTVITKVKALYRGRTAALKGTAYTGPTGDFSTTPVSSVAKVSVISPDGFTGTSDITYIVKCTSIGDGGFNATPTDRTGYKLEITSNGTDSNRVAVYPISGTAFAIGTQGATLTLTGGTMAVGGTLYVPIFAAAYGPYNVIETNDNIFAETGTSLIDIDYVTAVSYQLILNKPSVEIPETVDVNTSNWSTDASGIAIENDINVYDSDLIVSGGTSYAALPVEQTILDSDYIGATIFVQYRALLNSTSTSMTYITDTIAVADALGPVSIDNPLAEGVYTAALNAAGKPVYYIGVATDDVAGYTAALNIAKGSKAPYSLVPLTFDRTILALVQAHIVSMSTEVRARWRIGWFSSPRILNETLYSVDSNEDDYVGTLTDDTHVAGTTDVTLLTVSGATFVTDEVRAGDVVRINYRIDANGDQTYDEFDVTEVRTETTLVIDTGYINASNPAVTAIKVEVIRNYTIAEQVTALLAADTYNYRRIRNVFPDYATSLGVEKPGYYVAAALAGLRSAVVPHQGLTNYAIAGFDDVTTAVTTFNDDQLDQLADAGYWIVTQDVAGVGPVYTRHQLTTDRSDLNMQEDSITTNYDDISYGLMEIIAPYSGTYNINESTILLISTALKQKLNNYMSNTFTQKAGNQLIDYKITKIQKSPVFQDKLEINVELTLPYPLNIVSMTLVV